MEADAPASTSSPAAAAQHTPLPEVDMYAYLLVLMHKIDNKQWEQVGMEVVGGVSGWWLEQECRQLRAAYWCLI
jgi:hypothetical protein